MFSVNRIRGACPKCRTFYPRHGVPDSRFQRQPLRLSSRLQAPTGSPSLITRSFTTSKVRSQETAANPADTDSAEIEKVVRDAKQRFRDTLPKGYLNEAEYALYERLYGPPLRETRPEDVGIDTHADMGPKAPRPQNEGTLLRQLEDGQYEEITYEIQQDAPAGGNEEALAEPASNDVAGIPIQAAPGYVDVVARSPREHEALQRLVLDFEASQKEQLEEAKRLAAEEETEAEHEPQELESDWPLEASPDEQADSGFAREGPVVGRYRRFHPYTLDGRFHGNPVEMVLPHDELVTPIREILDRTHLRHVKEAAQAAFGGAGLPTSPATPEWRKNGQMGGVGLPPDQKHMTEIQADAFMAGYMSPAYASVMSILREVRRRVGPEWLQSRLKSGEEKELSVLDAGAGGAGLIAWDKILEAEWDLLKETGEAKGRRPIGRRSVIVGSERLRNRLKTFLPNTTFLPRLPDYEHSGEMRGGHLDAGGQPQQRKSYDVIIASHLFLKEKQDHYRQAILNNLWSLLKPNGGILIVIEKAHPRGFEAVAHVRDTLLKQFLLPRSGEPKIEAEPFNPAYQKELEPGHIIAPCTNHQVCPMYKEPGKSQGRRDYCHFSQRFVRPAFYNQVLGATDNMGEVEFSYVAIQRGVANDGHISGEEAVQQAFKGYEHSTSEPSMQSLPRLVLPPLKRKGHVTMDMCTPAGKIERWTVPKSFSKLAYHDARKSRWGDLWALGAKSRTLRDVRAGKGTEERAREAAEARKARKAQEKADLEGARAPREVKKKGNKHDKLRELMAAQEAAEEEELGEIMDEEFMAELEREEREDIKKKKQGGDF